MDNAGNVEFPLGRPVARQALAERMQADPKYRLLDELGYELVNWTGLTAFFRDRAAT